MTTLTQHSPSLSSPALRNDSSDYFSVSKNDLLDIHMSSPKQVVNDIKSPTTSSTVLAETNSPVSLPKWPLQNTHIHTNIEVSSLHLSPNNSIKNNHKSLGLEELSLREYSGNNKDMTFSSNAIIPNNVNDNPHLAVSQFNPKDPVNNGAQLNGSISTPVNPFDFQFVSSSSVDGDSKKKKLHNIKVLKALSSSIKAEPMALQLTHNFNLGNIVSSNSNSQSSSKSTNNLQSSSQNSSNSSVLRSLSTSRKIMSPQSANVISSGSSTKSSASLVLSSKSPTYHHSHIHSPTYQTTATANAKLPAYLMAAAAGSNHNLTTVTSTAEARKNNSFEPLSTVSHMHLSPISPVLSYSAQSSIAASSANSSSLSTINSIAPSKALNSVSSISSAKKNPNHIHPQSSTLNAMTAVAASSGSKPRFSAYAQSLHQTKYKGNSRSAEFDFNRSNSSNNRMSVMSTSSDIIGYTSQNYYKYCNHYLKNSFSDSIDEDSLEEHNKPSSKLPTVVVNKPPSKTTDELNHKQPSLAASPHNNNIYRTRTGNLSVSSLPSFSFNSSTYQRKLSNLTNPNRGGATKAYQKVILRKHQKLNQNSSDIVLNFRFGVQPNGSIASGMIVLEEKFTLPDNVYSISADSLNSCLCNNSSEGIRLIAVVDIRTFNEYAKKRINEAVNISLPTTLLKRKNYSLLRTILQLSEAEKLIFLPYVALPSENESHNDIKDKDGLIPSVVLYDSCTTPLESDESFLINFNLYYMSVKFAKGWKGNTYVLDGGLKEFCTKFPNMVISPSGSGGHFSSNSIGTDISMSPKISDSNSIDLSFSNSVSNHSDLNLTSSTSGYSHYNTNYSDIGSNFSNDNNLVIMHKTNDDSNSQRSDDDAQSISSVNSGFSGFELPSAKYFFRVRQNDELVNVDQCVKHLKLKNAEKIPPGFEFEMDKENSEYPLNIDDYEDDDNDPRINSIVRKFKQLEINEKTRINENIVKFHGVEMGLKNRYKDILPFDYNRVLLKSNDSSSADATPTYERGFRFDFNTNVYNDYINASNITIDLSKYRGDKSSTYRCIAAQAPLKNTVDDFIKMVKQNKIALIVTLTDCVENMVEKCYKYWNCQSSQYNISVHESFDTDADLEIKLLKIEDVTDGDMVEKSLYVLQLHLHNWADLLDFSNFVELIKMIKLKTLIMQQLNGDKDTNVDEQVGWLVHCSAGCGRTGTFIAIDSLLQVFTDLMERKDVNNVVFNIVNDLRQQRVSMVQTMRQYLMIYDLLIENMSLENNEDELFEKFIHEWDDVPVIQHFLEHYQKR